jgi:hypothetical protein
VEVNMARFREPNWSKYPKLASIFESCWDELRELFVEVCANAVQYVHDVKAEEVAATCNFMEHRRGEAVILTFASGYEEPGTIEWGDVSTGISVYLEQGGRIIVRNVDTWPKWRTDPDGHRPVWDRLP